MTLEQYKWPMMTWDEAHKKYMDTELAVEEARVDITGTPFPLGNQMFQNAGAKAIIKELEPKLPDLASKVQFAATRFKQMCPFARTMQ